MRNIFLLYLLISVSLASSNVVASDENDVKIAIQNVGGVDKFMTLMVETISKTVPKQLDSDTTIIAASSLGKSFNLTHMLINENGSNLSGGKKLADIFIQFQTVKICTNPFTKVVINDYGASVRYEYLSTTGAYLFGFEVNKSKCEVK